MSATIDRLDRSMDGKRIFLIMSFPNKEHAELFYAGLTNVLQMFGVKKPE